MIAGEHFNQFVQREDDFDGISMMIRRLSVAACELAADAGPCHDFTDNWFYSVQSKRCEQFSYGGCEGNDNRFSSEAECERMCVRERKLQQQGW